MILNRLDRLPLFASLIVLITAMGCDRPPASAEEERATVDASICDADDGGIALPDGFCAAVVADGLGRLRHIAVRDNGDVYVIHREAADEGGITALRDTDGDGAADEIRTFGEIAGTGLALHDGYLYASTDTSVHRFALSDEEIVPSGDPELIVDGFPVQGSHAAKSIAFDESGNVYVNVGAPSNACQQQARSPGSAGQDPCPQLERHAGIWRFRADVPNQMHADGHRFATGIRNAVALEWNPAADRVYVVQHGRDQLSQLWGELYSNEESAELPAEEMLMLTDGSDFGWPYCYYDHVQGEKVLAPEYGGDGTEAGRCADRLDPVVAFPGHYGPNDLVFYASEQFPARYHDGAFIAFHGSWNRAPLPQEGYQIAFVPMTEGGEPTGEWETFADGFKGTTMLESPGDAAYRPTGIALGPDGSLYVSDSVGGRIWRIVYSGEVM